MSIGNSNQIIILFLEYLIHPHIVFPVLLLFLILFSFPKTENDTMRSIVL